MRKQLKIDKKDIVSDESVYGYKGLGCLHILENKNNAKVVAEKAAYENSSLVSVCLPEGIEEIGAKAFANCENLIEIILPKTIKAVHSSAFSGTKLGYVSKLKNGMLLLSSYDASKVTVDKEWEDYSVTQTKPWVCGGVML